MNKIFVSIIVLLSLYGCSTTVPVTAKFPDAPESLLVKCPQLKKIDEEAKLSEIGTTVVENYSTYYECAVKDDAWIEWYQIQKHISEGIK